jgi:primosomal replication protein N
MVTGFYEEILEVAMDRLNAENSVVLCGTVSEKPAYTHSVKGQRHFSFPLTVARLSGTEDKINISCREELLEGAAVGEHTGLRVYGELRSYNNKSGVGNKLQIFVYAYELEFSDDEPENHIFLSGALCKEPKLRVTPLGREICDLLVAVNRPLGRSDYLPCICWGQTAREAAVFGVGQDIEIEGRIQSRDYIKVTDGVQLTKTAFEVSAMEIRDGTAAREEEPEQ